MVGGAAASVGLHVWVEAWEQDRVESMLAARARERAQLLQTKILCSMESLHSLASYLTVNHGTSRSQFHEFVQPALDRQPDLQALGWAPIVSQAHREEYEAKIRADGWPSFQITERDGKGSLVPAAGRAEFFPVCYIEPIKTNYPAIGYDLGSNAIRRQAVLQAGASGTAVATSLIHLVQESGHQFGFLVCMPVYESSDESPSPNQRKLIGVASAVFRVQDLVSPAVSDLTKEGLNVKVLDLSAGGSPIVEARAGRDEIAFQQRADLTVAGRHWAIALTPTPTFVARHEGDQSNTVLWTTLVATLGLAAYLYAGFRRTAEIELRVAVRTHQLSKEVLDRKRAEEAARLAEARYRSIFENSIEGIFQTTPEGKYLSANRALARIYGYESTDELVSDLTNIAGQLYVEPRRREDFIRQIHADGAVSDFESQVYRKDGKIIWISENARAARDAEGNLLYYEGTVVDVTERKRYRDELETRVRERTLELADINQALQKEIAVRKRAEDSAAAASRAKSAFLASMSHEIRTPMNAILGYAQLLERDPTLRAMHREALQTVLSSGNHLLGLIDDVLEISKIEAGRAELRPSEFDVDELLNDVAGMFRQRCRQKDLSLMVEDRTKGRHRVVGDQRKLRQVLINLVGNAVKFTDEGSVTVRVTLERAERYRFEVIDTGIGILAEARDAIFEAFNQGPTDHRRGGSGLGLTICRQHIELMGGTLEVTSSRNEDESGSRFSFAIDLAYPGHCDDTPPEIEMAPLILAPGRSVRAIVVDDVAENRDVLARMLASSGCEVATAQSGRHAIDMMEQFQAEILFIDIMMPGMDGIETARQIRRRFPGETVRLVATSASALSHERQEYLDAGFDDFLAKPVRCGRVNHLLKELLHVEFVPERDVQCEMSQGVGDMAGLPESLRERLLQAASQYRITDLKQCIDDVERLPQNPAGLGEALRRCLRRYDMEGIAQIVGAAEAVGG